MADKNLRFSEMERLFCAHGCQFRFNSKTQYITITQGAGADHLYKRIHAHSGKKDSFDRWVVASAPRALGFGNVSDDEFYAPLG